MKLNTVIDDLQDLYNHLVVKGGKENHMRALENAVTILEEILDDAKETPSTVVWKDDSQPATKVGVWPFQITVGGIPPMVWVAYDTATGTEIHKIIRGSVGYSVHKVNGRIASIEFMTLEQAKAFCEKAER